MSRISYQSSSSGFSLQVIKNYDEDKGNKFETIYVNVFYDITKLLGKIKDEISMIVMAVG